MLLIFCVIALLSFSPLYAQEADTLRMDPSAHAQFSVLLNNPSMVIPAAAVPLGKNWFTLETDAHVFTDEVNLAQIRAALLDIDNYTKNFDGKRSKLRANVVNKTESEQIVDFVSVAIAPVVNFKLSSPYRAAVKTAIDTNTMFGLNVTHLEQDSKNNKHIKNLTAPRYAEEVVIGDKKYTYLRLYSKMDVNAGILPGAKGLLERNSFPVNVESIQMIIEAAKAK